MFGQPCLCDNRLDVKCTETSCSIAGPGAPFDANNCRWCYQRLSGDMSVPAGSGPPLQTRYPLSLRKKTPCLYLREPTGEKRDCEACGGGKDIPIYGCVKHECCARQRLGFKENGFWVEMPNCLSCGDYRPMGDVESVFLRFPHGLGDAVAFTAVLAHLKKHYPKWQIDLAVNPDFAPLFTGLARNVLPPMHQPGNAYSLTLDLEWKEGIGTPENLPSTKVVRCLREVFRIEPDPELLRYRFQPTEEDHRNADKLIQMLAPQKGIVAIHYQGHSCKDSKDLPQEAVDKLRAYLAKKGYTPLVLDWQDSPGFLTALLSKTSLNILIDSGPQKLAMTTQTPLLAVWTRSHPIHYVDDPDFPSRMVQLVPENHGDYLNHTNGVDRECDKDKALDFFHRHYRHFCYQDLAAGLIFMATYLLGFGRVKPTRPTAPRRRRLKLHTGLPPGDVMTLTAAVEMLHEHHKGKYLTGVSTEHPELWEHNPHVVPMDDSFEHVEMEYHLVHQSGNRPVHFLQGYTEMLGSHLGIALPLTTNRPHLYLSDQEKDWMNQAWQVTGNNGPYWVLNAGVKRDYTAKQYPWFQEVVGLLRHRVRFVQIGKESDLHQPLRGVVNLLGKTSHRALIRLVYHAQGVLSGVTFLMHLAAAFEKPAVIVAGGREPRLWNSYPTQTLLSTVGSLDCCRTGGCWRGRVAPLGDEKPDEKFCERPMPTELPAGECMTRISPELVAKAIESYLP